MNKTIETMNNHRSIRKFTQQSVSDEIIEALISASQSAPNSINGQQISIVGIRKDPAEMIKLLNLPKHTFPVVGLCVGYPESPSKKKPRMDQSAYFHKETYNHEIASGIIDSYDTLMVHNLEDIGRSEEINWSQNISNSYQTVYFPKVYPILKEQGFANEK